MSLLIKKGQTLIEVVVALGILALVFTGTITLIVQVVNLELSAKNRTEAVTLAQRKLTEARIGIENGCSQTSYLEVGTENGSIVTLNFAVIADDNFDAGFPIGVVDASATSFDYGGPPGLELDGNNFIRIISVVQWSDRGLPDETYTIEQIVRRNQ